MVAAAITPPPNLPPQGGEEPASTPSPLAGEGWGGGDRAVCALAEQE
jgi:hypothetical protein